MSVEEAEKLLRSGRRLIAAWRAIERDREYARAYERHRYQPSLAGFYLNLCRNELRFMLEESER